MKGLRLTEMTCKGMVMQVLENMQLEIARVWNIDVSEVAEQTIRSRVNCGSD